VLALSNLDGVSAAALGHAPRGLILRGPLGLAGENAAVATLPALPAAETRAAEALLARIWAPGTSVRAAEPIWDRSHVVRLHLATDRSVVMKKQADKDSFRVELATLEYLNGMPRTRRPAAAGRRRRHLAVLTNHMIARRLSHAELRTLQTGNDCGPEVGSISQA